MSWVHEIDFVRAIYWLIDHHEVEGPVNIAAPEPLPNAAFMRGLRNAWGVSLGLLTNRGFTFQFPRWPEAAEDLCRRWPEQNSRVRRTA